MPLKGITQVEAADRLRVSTSWIRTLTRRGILPRNDDGSYPWPEVADAFDAYQVEIAEDEEPESETATLEEARTRKFLVEALLREDELAARRGDLVPVDEVLEERIRRPLERIDAKLRTAVRRHSKAWAARLGVRQSVAMAMMHDIIEEVRAELLEVMAGDPDA